MAAADETIRRLVAAVASNAYRAHPEKRAPQRPPSCPEHLRGQYEDEVDPDGTLPTRARLLRANAAWRRDEAKRALDAHRAALGLEVGKDGRGIPFTSGPDAA